jgi:tetratricopeptide (TPR) repeat protein
LLFFVSHAQNSRELDSLEKELKVPHHDTIIVQLNNKLCWENRLINFAKAMNYGEKALKLGRKINYQKGILKSLSFLGVTCINAGNHPLALQYFLEALDLAQSTNNFVEVSYTYNQQIRTPLHLLMIYGFQIENDKLAKATLKFNRPFNSFNNVQ